MHLTQNMTSSQSFSERYRFSPETPSDHLALSTPDGTLLVYDTRLATLKNRFVPTSHLSAACTCLAWRPPLDDAVQTKSSGKKSRKRKSSVTFAANGDVASNLHASDLAVGTASGAVIIYSTKTAEAKETTVHSDKINDLAWDSEGSVVFSCSDDGHVGRVVAKKAVGSKFRVDTKRHKLHSLALHPDGSSILVGATAKIFWVDLDTQIVLRTFTSHKGDVTVLNLFTISPKYPPFLLSAGANEKDHMISVWRLDAEAKSESVDPEAMLNVNESVRSVCVATKVEDDGEEEIVIGSVSKSGVFHAFEFDPDSKRKKNKAMRPKVTVQVATEKDASGKVTSIPILASRINPNLVIQLAHGSHAKPAFETLEHSKLDKVTCLVRKVESVTAEKDLGIKFMIPDKSGATVLAPGASMTPVVSSATGTKRKNSRSGKLDELPMLERLRLLSKETEHITTPPRTDSLLQLLLQGLHNQDRKILDSVLDRADDELIDKTVRKLPVEGVIPLIEELQVYIKGRGMVYQCHAKWLRSVLQHHTAYLMSNPHCEELLGPVLSMLEARTKHYSALIQLKGKLDIMTKQIASKPEESSSMEGVNKEALLVYQDDSSDELSDVLDELLLPASDTEENWNLDEDDDDEDSEEEDEEDEEDETGLVNGVDDEDMDSD